MRRVLGRAAAVALLACASVGVPAAEPPATASPPQAIAFKQDDGELGPLLLRSLLAMAAIVAVGFGVIHVMRRHGIAPAARPASRSLRVIESVRLGPRAALFVVQFGDSRLLVGQGEHGVSLIARETAPTEPPR